VADTKRGEKRKRIHGIERYMTEEKDKIQRDLKLNKK
jgi:hypothetical protein